MTDEATGSKRSAIDRFRQTDSIKVAIVAVVVAWLGKGGFDTLVNRWLHDSGPFEARIEVKIDNLQKSVDQLWKVKGPKDEQAGR